MLELLHEDNDNHTQKDLSDNKPDIIIEDYQAATENERDNFTKETNRIETASFVRGSSAPYLRVRVQDRGLASCPGVFSSGIRPRRSSGDGPISGVHTWRFPETAGDQEELSVGTPTSSSTVTAVSGNDGEVRCVPRTRGGAECGERTAKGRGATTRVALKGALRIPGALRAHDRRDAGSLHAGGALPQTISP
ncbi:hypothetical protein EVAR_64401_1 [Eumeta japonica]|uniref:Uncharacterized protein n=1 Tax=Eumeta variegata TaxID=151549 RepID=A0A4C1ZS88_EUMVA|nr:hypothetical protein EVAR_64401_1 [Eumeta japonica]